MARHSGCFSKVFVPVTKLKLTPAIKEMPAREEEVGDVKGDRGRHYITASSDTMLEHQGVRRTRAYQGPVLFFASSLQA